HPLKKCYRLSHIAGGAFFWQLNSSRHPLGVEFSTLRGTSMRFLKLIGAVFATSLLSFAQIGTSTITGRVTDTTGAVVPNVTVTITTKATNVNTNAVTNEDVIYRVPSLQPGEYRVSFEAPGFKKSLLENVDLRTGDTQAVDASLEVGQVSESV